MAYNLSGALLEVCTCKILCPCWVGEDPDNGDCQSIMAWHFESGTIDGSDVSGLTFAIVTDIPGNVLSATGAPWCIWMTRARHNKRKRC